MRKIGVAIIVLAVLPVAACADLTIKERISTEGFMGLWSSEGMETIYLKGEMMRTESVTELKGMMPGRMNQEEMETMTIIRLDKGVIWEVDPLESTYIETGLDRMNAGASGENFRFSVDTVTVARTGETREIAGRQCEGIEATVTFTTRAGDGTVTQSADVLLWMIEARDLRELRTFWERMMDLTQGMEQGLPMGDAMDMVLEEIDDPESVPLGMELTLGRGSASGGDEEMQEAMNMLKQYMDSGEEDATDSPEYQIRVTAEVLSVSTGELDPALFEVPEGFVKTERKPSSMTYPRGK
jgi:hypothetical protein